MAGGEFEIRMGDGRAGLEWEALDKGSWIGDVIAQQLEAVAGMHWAPELFGQSHDATWHPQQAIAHEVALLVRADDDLGRRGPRQRRPARHRPPPSLRPPLPATP